MSDPSIVNVGIDTLKVNVRPLDDEGELTNQPALPLRLKQRCEEWQAEAKDQGKPVATSFTFAESRLKMFPNGADAWTYILRNDAIEVKLEPRLRLVMPAKVVFQSAYLWAVDTPQDAVDAVKRFLENELFEGQRVFLQVAQMDLCVDVMGFVPPEHIQQAFLTRSRKKETIDISEKHREVINGRKLETVLFSKHGRPVSGKLYDKVAEIKQSSKKEWFYPRWKEHGWNDGADVWRMEFSIEREGFHEFKIEGVYQALSETQRLWHYCSQEWLRMITPGRGKRTRRATHPTWTLIQQAFEQEQKTKGLGPLVRERTREINQEQLIAQVAGCAITLAAWDSTIDDRSQTLEDEVLLLVRTAIRERWRKTRLVIQDAVREKKLLYNQLP